MSLLFLDQPEDMTDQMKSILAQMEFAHEILSWESKGVQFRTYLYVPEVCILRPILYFVNMKMRHMS